MTEDKAEIENLLVFFDKTVDLTYGAIQETLNGQEWQMFKHWLSLCRIDYATYELERARIRIVQEVRRTLSGNEVSTEELAINNVLQLWQELITSTGGPEEAYIQLFSAAWIGHFVR